MDTGWRREGEGERNQRVAVTSDTPRKLQYNQRAQPLLSQDSEGWDGAGRRFKREGMYVNRQLMHLVVQQKLTPHCNYIPTKNLKKKNRKESRTVPKVST